MQSAFGIEHGFNVSKMTDKQKKGAVIGGGAAAAVGGTTAVALGTKMPEHSHYSKKTRKYLSTLEPGVPHTVDTKILAKKPRKLGARKQQRSYVAAMAQERPVHTYGAVPIVRYKDGIVQRDNAHSVMSNAMKGRKTVIQIEDAKGYRPSRRTGEELVRRGQMRYQQRRLKKHTNIGEKKINDLQSKYKKKSRIANTSKRPHGVVEEGFKMAKKPFGIARALSIAKNDRDRAAGATGAAGVGVLATTPVRRSAAKVDVSGGKMSSSDAKKVLSPGYRPGNKKAIRGMARNMGKLENTSTTVIRYKGGGVIPFDGNHRGTARVARGDKSIPVKVIQGGERPAISVGRNAYHGAAQKLHQSRMNRDVYKPDGKIIKPHKESKLYHAIANGSKTRSGKGGDIGSLKLSRGPSKMMLRGRQGATIGAGAALLGTAGYLNQKKDRNG